MKRLFSRASLLLILSGCTSMGTRPVVLDPTPRPATSAASLPVFASSPSRPHRVVATWRQEESSLFGSQAEALRRRIVHEAAALGASAVILTLKEDSGLALDPSGPSGLTPFGYVTKAKAQFIVWQ